MICKRFSVSALFLPSVSLLAVLAVCVSSVQAAERTALSLNGIWQIESQIKRIDGSSISTTEIDQTVKRLMKSAEVTGAAIAVLNDGKVVYTRAYGFRDKEKNLPLTTDSVMSGASLTKAAFAFLVLELVDDGKLDLDKPIQQYLAKPLPEYSRYADLAADDRYKKITARMLLSHSAGFPNWRAFEDDRKLHIHFDPGLRYAYSGEGIDLLQLVVEVITNQSVGELMQDRIFTPLGMTRTSMTWQSRFESDFANGYDEYGRLLGPQKRQNPDAAGSLLTTVSDYARLVAAISNGKLFSAKSRAQLLSPQIRIHSKHQFPSLANELSADNDLINLSYGLGWGLYTSPYGTAFFKEGHDDGWRNYVVCFEKPKSGIVILTNSGNGEGIFKYLLETILKDTFTPIEWEGYTPYDKLPPRPALTKHARVSIDGKLLDRYAGRYGQLPDLILTIRRAGDHLTIQENDEPPQDLLPESEANFYSTSSDDTLTFESKDGHVTRLVLHLGDRDLPINRLD